MEIEKPQIPAPLVERLTGPARRAAEDAAAAAAAAYADATAAAARVDEAHARLAEVLSATDIANWISCVLELRNKLGRLSTLPPHYRRSLACYVTDHRGLTQHWPDAIKSVTYDYRERLQAVGVPVPPLPPLGEDNYPDNRWVEYWLDQAARGC